MVRSAQMLVATSCLLSKDVDLLKEIHGHDHPEFLIYAQVIAMFLDHEQSPLSIHRIVKSGALRGTRIGSWFGPNTISVVLQQLINDCLWSPVHCHLSHDATLYESDLQVAFATGKSVLILIPIRLGVEALNPVYYELVKQVFLFPHCVGIAG